MLALILSFIKISFLGFGGGYAMLSLIYSESINLGITVQQFADLNALDLVAPGPIAINSATYVGYITQGLLGAVLATLAVSTSSFFFSGLILRYEEKLMNNEVITKFLNLTKIAAIGMIFSVALLLFKEAMQESMWILSLISILCSAVMRFKFKFNPLLVILLTGIIGSFAYII